MFFLLAAFLCVLYALGSGSRAPLRVLAVAWFVSIAPILSGLVAYDFLPYADWRLPVALIGFISCFVSGVLLSDLNGNPYCAIPDQSARCLMKDEFVDNTGVAKACWCIAMIGTACICIDFLALQGAGLDDIAALRDTYVGKSEASVFARLGSVMTWACLYCFAFAMTYRSQLRPAALAVYMLPIGGFFLVSLFSAGRQASFQIMIFTILILWLNHKRSPASERKASTRTAAVFAASISSLMIAYMGYIAVARNDGNVSDDKVEVLTTLFDLRVNAGFDSILKSFGTGVRTTVTEAIVYFSSSIALFSKFLNISFADYSRGAVTFPFFFRQLEPLTSISVIGALQTKVDAMTSAGVIGVGWETGISSYIQDFGILGACLFLFVQGYYTAYVWRRAINGYSFNDSMIAVVALAAIVYLPLVAALSDTNLLLFWIFCIFAAQRGARIKRRRLRGSTMTINRV